MKIYSFFLVMLMGAFAACSPSVQTDVVSGVNFEQFDTYAYLPSGQAEGENVVYNERIINEVNQEMQARGYRLDTQNPDLLVLVRSMYDEESRLEATTIPTTYDYYGPGFVPPATMGTYYYTGYNTIPRLTGATTIREVEYTEGTFVVDVINAETNEIIWRGWSSTPVDPMAIDTSIREYVDNIFEEFPVEPKS